MGWLSIILMIVQYGPSIFSLVSEIIDLIRKLPKGERAVETMALKADVEHFRKTKDRARLRRLRDRLHGRCFGECQVTIG